MPESNFLPAFSHNSQEEAPAQGAEKVPDPGRSAVETPSINQNWGGQVLSPVAYCRHTDYFFSLRLQ
jgi:hypothetical protein